MSVDTLYTEVLLFTLKMLSSETMKHKKISDQEYQYIRLELKNELLRRIQSNPRYSMRAFAANIGMPVSTLESLINGKRRPSREMFQKICIILQVDLTQIRAISECKHYDILKEDELKTITDWYYFPILELLVIKNFDFTPSTVSRALGISIVEAKDAIERLNRLGLICKNENGKWIDLTAGFISTISEDLTSTARRHQQKELLKKSIEALESIPVDKRSHTSSTLAINSKDVPKAKKLLDKFRRELSELLAETQEADQIYTLLLNFFPNTHILF